MSESDETVQRIIEYSKKKPIIIELLEINRKVEFLAETGTLTRDFKKAFGNTTVVAWLFCSIDNVQHKSLCEKFFGRLNEA